MSTTMPETATATETATAQTTDAATTATEAVEQAQTATTAQTATPSAAETPAWNPDAWDGKVETLPADAQRMIRDLRKAEGDERVATKTLEAIQKALNPDSEEKVDPVKLQQQFTDLGSAHTSLQREHQVLLSALDAGADHKALLDSRSFLAKVAGLDPAADDFATKVDAEVTSALKDNPKLKAARAAGSSSADHSGGSGEGAVTKAQFDAMSYDQQVELFTNNPTLYRRLSGG